MPTPNETIPTPIVQIRRSNGKSRSGCMPCKKRKVKCDEVQPVCSRCNDRPGDKCVYKIKDTPTWKKAVSSFVLPANTNTRPKKSKTSTPSRRPSSSQTTIFPDPSGWSTSEPSSAMSLRGAQSIGSEDAFLLAHFISIASRDLLGDQELWIGGVLPLAFKNKFLLYAVLTLSARHLQILSESHSLPLYNYQGLVECHLQKALSSFYQALKDQSHTSYDALMATSFLLCLYACSNHDFKPLASVPCEDISFTFLLGTRSMVIDNPKLAYSGVMRELINPPAYLPLFLPRVAPTTGPGALLLTLLDALPPNSTYVTMKKVYIERIESLTIYLATVTAQNPDSQSVEGLLLCFLRWQSVCPPEYIALVRSYDPIALVILAHYYAAAGFVLSRAKETWWWWQGKPRYMVETIHEFLGSPWAAWLEWPVALMARC